MLQSKKINFLLFSSPTLISFFGVILCILGLIVGGIISFPLSRTEVYILIALILGIYLGFSIGANGISSVMGPMVGSKTLSIVGAVIIGGVFEFAGALFGGGKIIETFETQLIHADIFQLQEEKIVFILLGVLFASAIWVHISTWLKIPVSTIQTTIFSFLGGVCLLIGWENIYWGTISILVLSWIIVPIIGGCITCILAITIHKTIFERKNIFKGARRWIPIYVALMIGVFTDYILSIGVSPTFEITKDVSFISGFTIGLLTLVILKFYIKEKLKTLPKEKETIQNLFLLPLILAGAIFSFAHGSNELVNTIGPLALIYNHSLIETGVSVGNSIPLWIISIGGASIALGSIFFGKEITKNIGKEITKISKIYAFCIMLGTAITILGASIFSIPVSSIHIILCSIFALGYAKMILKDKKSVVLNIGNMQKILVVWVLTFPVSFISGAIFSFIFSKILT